MPLKVIEHGTTKKLGYGFQFTFHSNYGCIFTCFDRIHQHDRHPARIDRHCTAQWHRLHLCTALHGNKWVQENTDHKVWPYWLCLAAVQLSQSQRSVPQCCCCCCWWWWWLMPCSVMQVPWQVNQQECETMISTELSQLRHSCLPQPVSLHSHLYS